MCQLASGYSIQVNIRFGLGRKRRRRRLDSFRVRFRRHHRPYCSRISARSHRQKMAHLCNEHSIYRLLDTHVLGEILGGTFHCEIRLWHIGRCFVQYSPGVYWRNHRAKDQRSVQRDVFHNDPCRVYFRIRSRPVIGQKGNCTKFSTRNVMKINLRVIVNLQIREVIQDKRRNIAITRSSIKKLKRFDMKTSNSKW